MVFNNSSDLFLQEEKDIKFKFARTRVWMYYVSEISVLPPPFNLFPVEKAVMGVHWLARRYNWIRKVSLRLNVCAQRWC